MSPKFLSSGVPCTSPHISAYRKRKLTYIDILNAFLKSPVRPRPKTEADILSSTSINTLLIYGKTRIWISIWKNFIFIPLPWLTHNCFCGISNTEIFVHNYRSPLAIDLLIINLHKAQKRLLFLSLLTFEYSRC